jgi:hypothetical protein
VNPPELTILNADTDAACDPETGTCTLRQTPIPSPGAAPVQGVGQAGLEPATGRLSVHASITAPRGL